MTRRDYRGGYSFTVKRRQKHIETRAFVCERAIVNKLLHYTSRVHYFIGEWIKKSYTMNSYQLFYDILNLKFNMFLYNLHLTKIMFGVYTHGHDHTRWLFNKHLRKLSRLVTMCWIIHIFRWTSAKLFFVILFNTFFCCLIYNRGY